MDISYIVFLARDGQVRKFPNQEAANAFVDRQAQPEPGTYLILTELEWDIIKTEIKGE
jgi:hypothetical protein